jgi:hypothetical protein
MMDLEEHGGLLRRLIALLEHFLERLEDMSAQSDVDAATAAMTSAATTLNTDAPEISALLTAGVDTSALSAAIAPLAAAVAGISALANPAPPVTTATATTSTVVSSPPTTGTGAPGDPVRPA